MAKGDRYLKVVVWSDEDKCFIGTCPQLMYGGSYGDDAQQVFAELCELVEEAIETLEEAGKPLPQPLSLQELENLLRRDARGLVTPAVRPSP
jgi:predicted RNase H-like HicB family nuclease